MRVIWSNKDTVRDKCASDILLVVQVKKEISVFKTQRWNMPRSWSHSSYFLDVDFLSVSKYPCPYLEGLLRTKMFFHCFNFMCSLSIRLKKNTYALGQKPHFFFCFLISSHLFIQCVFRCSLLKGRMNTWLKEWLPLKAGISKFSPKLKHKTYLEDKVLYF